MSVRRRMEELAKEIRASMSREPDAYDERERLWMEREDLRSKLLRRATMFETKLVGACGTLLALIPV